MKKKLLLNFLFGTLCILYVSAQVPQGINYQAVARGTNGQILANAKMQVRFSVLEGSSDGPKVYSELQQVTTNQFGLFTAVIGGGLKPEGHFDNISWGNGNKFLQVEIDATGEGSFLNMGTQQMMAVPFALYAARAASVDNNTNQPDGDYGRGLNWNCYTHTLTDNGNSVQLTNCDGTFGSTGPQGPRGATGATGAHGNTGAQGPQGPQGYQGPRGVEGPQGPAGQKGATGNTGATGAQGTQGLKGVTGNTGAAGNMGPQGPPGPAGNNGAPGATGATGAQGATGPQGPAGNDGQPGAGGATGATGQAGATGPQGSAGNDGQPGNQGATGTPGQPGPTGPQGPAGTPGNNVPDGVNTGDLLVWDATGNNYVAQSIATGNTGGSQPFSIMQPYLAINFCIALQGIFPARSGADPFLGEIEMYGFNFAPQGWALCNGQLLSIQQNAALFTLLGTQYGGDGQTTFALPNLQGRVPLNMGTSANGVPYYIGQTGGSETNTLNINQMPVHNHTIVFGNP